MHGDEILIYSADRLITDEHEPEHLMPIENLNALNPPRTPPHILRLKPSLCINFTPKFESCRWSMQWHMFTLSACMLTSKRASACVGVCYLEWQS